MTFTTFVQYVKDNLCLELTDKKCQRLQIYLAMLKEWNEFFNLTAITDDEKVIEKHFLDSLLPSKYLDFSNNKLIDVGSGAGFPGLVLAIVFDDALVTLLEPNNKKVRFLKAVVEKLSLTNVTIVMGRAETQVDLRETFDIAIARAVKPLNILLELVIPFIKVKGSFVAMKSQGVNEEIKQANNAFTLLKCKVTQCFEDVLPTDKDIRVNLLINKYDLTPLRFPRSYNLISAKPL